MNLFQVALTITLVSFAIIILSLEILRKNHAKQMRFEKEKETMRELEKILPTWPV